MFDFVPRERHSRGLWGSEDGKTILVNWDDTKILAPDSAVWNVSEYRPSYRKDSHSIIRTADDIARTFAREAEQGVVQSPIPPLDLRTVPHEQWNIHVGRDLVVPPEIVAYLADPNTSFPLNDEATEALGARVAVFYGLLTPYYVEVSDGIQCIGRAWRYVPEAGNSLTGFALQKE